MSFHHLTLIKKLLHLIDKSEKKLEFRLFGEDYHVNYDIMHQVFGFPKSGIYQPLKNYDLKIFWHQISGQDDFRGAHMAPNGLIIDHRYLIIHKFMCHAILGKLKGIKCQTKNYSCCGACILKPKSLPYILYFIVCGILLIHLMLQFLWVIL